MDAVRARPRSFQGVFRLYDVTVVGAGPAGNIAAHRLSSLGFRVLVLDWRKDIGDKLCTGIVGRECLEKYPPESAHIIRAASSATVVAPSGKSYKLAKDQPQAYVIDRVAFVASLADKAERSGATFALGPRVEDIRVSADDVAVVANDRGHSQEYRSRLLIIASGFGSPLLGMAGVDNGHRNGHMVAFQAEVDTNGLSETEVYLGQAIAPGSFGWLVPLEGGRSLAGLASRHKLNGHMDHFLSSLRGQGKVTGMIKEPQRWGIPMKPASRTYGDKVLVAGDAAGLAKPTTGGGIYYALLSGEMAARAAHEAFVAGDLSAGQLKGYEKSWKAVFGQELRIGYYARMMYEVLGDNQIERLLRETLTGEVQQDLLSSSKFSFDWHSGLIKTLFGHRNLSEVFRSFGPKAAPILSTIRSFGPL